MSFHTRQRGVRARLAPLRDFLDHFVVEIVIIIEIVAVFVVFIVVLIVDHHSASDFHLRKEEKSSGQVSRGAREKARRRKEDERSEVTTCPP